MRDGVLIPVEVGGGWEQRGSDPTPRNPVALKLAAADGASAVLYVARPCQFAGVDRDPDCTEKYWTSHRFAPEVIDSTSAVIDRAKKVAGVTAVELIGFSGGGAVAGRRRGGEVRNTPRTRQNFATRP